MAVTTQQKVVWLSYEFDVHLPGVNWNHVAGVYIFAGLNAQGRWVALYIGQTDDFANRLPNHERWAEAKMRGATHIHAMVVSEQARRDLIERQLIQTNQPPMNEQLK